MLCIYPFYCLYLSPQIYTSLCSSHSNSNSLLGLREDVHCRKQTRFVISNVFVCHWNCVNWSRQLVEGVFMEKTSREIFRMRKINMTLVNIWIRTHSLWNGFSATWANSIFITFAVDLQSTVQRKPSVFSSLTLEPSKFKAQAEPYIMSYRSPKVDV